MCAERGARSRSASRSTPKDPGARVPRESKAQTCLRTPNRNPEHRRVCALQTGIQSTDVCAHSKPAVRHSGLECGGTTPLWMCAGRARQDRGVQAVVTRKISAPASRGKPKRRRVCALQTSGAAQRSGVRRHDAALDLRGTREAKTWSAVRRKATSRRPLRGKPKRRHVCALQTGIQSTDVCAHSKRESKAQTCLRTPKRNRDVCEQTKAKLIRKLFGRSAAHPFV